MRKRISKDKDIRGAIEKKNFQSPLNPHIKNLQMLTLGLLATKTDGVQTATKFQKQRIDAIVRGGNISSVQYQQIEKNTCFEQYIHKYYPIQNIRYIFTDLIHTNARKVLTFVDFKRKNFKIMSSYANQLRLANCPKDKQELTLTTLHSSDKENICFKQMEMKVKKMTKKRNKSPKKIINQHQETSLFQLLANIQKMYKNTKYSNQGSICKQITINHFDNHKQIGSPDISKIYQSRIHTLPQYTMAVDSYGLGTFKNKLKSENSASKRKKQNNKMIKQSSKQSVRYQTQYDTSYIEQTKQKVSKLVSIKKSFSKIKNLSKSKSPPPLTPRLLLKVKK